MLEEFKLAGAIVAFATGAFTLVDRCLRGRPLAWPTIKVSQGAPFKFIRIKNPGHRDVFVLGVRVYPAGIYGVARTDATDAILSATVPTIYGDADLHVLLRRDAEHDLPIYYRSKNKT